MIFYSSIPTVMHLLPKKLVKLDNWDLIITGNVERDSHVLFNLEDFQ